MLHTRYDLLIVDEEPTNWDKSAEVFFFLDFERGSNY